MTQVNGMSAECGTPTRPTDHDALHAVVPLLRPVDVPTEKLTVVRPAPPKQRLTATPLAFDRAAYDASYDRFQHAADRAFGDEPDGAA